MPPATPANDAEKILRFVAILKANNLHDTGCASSLTVENIKPDACNCWIGQ